MKTLDWKLYLKLYGKHYGVWVVFLAVSRYGKWSLTEIFYPVFFALVTLILIELLERYYLVGLVCSGIAFYLMFKP